MSSWCLTGLKLRGSQVSADTGEEGNSAARYHFVLCSITASPSLDHTNLATDCGSRSGKKGAEENFVRKLRLLGSGGDVSLFLTSLWHYGCLADEWKHPDLPVLCSHSVFRGIQTPIRDLTVLSGARCH